MVFTWFTCFHHVFTFRMTIRTSFEALLMEQGAKEMPLEAETGDVTRQLIYLGKL